MLFFLTYKLVDIKCGICFFNGWTTLCLLVGCLINLYLLSKICVRLPPICWEAVACLIKFDMYTLCINKMRLPMIYFRLPAGSKQA